MWLPLLLVLAGCSAPPTASRPPAPPPPSASPPASPTPSPAAALCEHPPCRGRPRTVGAFGSQLAPEASGLAASRRNPGLLYLVDDGPGTTFVGVVHAGSGRPLGRLAIEGLEGTDTEDLAVGPCEAAGSGRTCLYIADIGDNVGARSSVTVTRVTEPDLSEGVPDAPVSAERVALTYPHGPADAETLLVDPQGSLLVVTKAAGRRGRGAARLFVADTFADQQLAAAGRVRIPQPAMPFAAAVVGNVVTGGDAAPGRVVLRTYDAIFEFLAPRPDAPLSTFARWPVREVPAPAEPQGEAVAYGRDGCDLYTVSEDSPRLSIIPCRR